MNSELTWSNVISKANVSFNKELQNNIFSDLPFSNVFPLNKSDLSIFARNVLRGFHYISSTLKFKSVPFVQKKILLCTNPRNHGTKQNYMKIKQYSLRCGVPTEVNVKTAIFGMQHYLSWKKCTDILILRWHLLPLASQMVVISWQ